MAQHLYATAQRLLAWSVRHRRALQAALALLAVAALAAGLYRFVAHRIWDDPRRLAVGLYVMPMYVLALAWAMVMLEQPQTLQPGAVLVDLAAVAVAASRCVVPIIPASGHMVFLLYSLLVTRNRAWRGVMAASLAATLACKLILWHDIVTSSAGAVVAIMLWRLRCRAELQVVPSPAALPPAGRRSGP